MRARHYIERPRVVAERERIEAQYQPSAREWFPVLREKLLASRPVIGTRVTKRMIRESRADSKGVKLVPSEPIYGKPTFRNVIELEPEPERKPSLAAQLRSLPGPYDVHRTTSAAEAVRLAARSGRGA